MTEKPDFDALRAQRNAEVEKQLREFAEKHGWVLKDTRTSFDRNACYCACATGGPCEHQWDGKGWQSEDGCAWSATCSRCGGTAMSHDARVLP
ncbi:MAG: hypothetical protein ING91_19260 [Rhodocyclaceae bacterium]|nr:hypothetical protein [Rhodocyclaceae bacterium]MCA3116373.1 hypothetical protein [Rhodocyclaceae bacterium]MCA3128564.1 hypothetical protein [Rhodocyclaceae bacterium]